MKISEPFVAPGAELFVNAPGAEAGKLFLCPLACGHYVYLPGFSLRRTAYSFQLLYIVRGALLFDLPLGTLKAPAGSVVLVDCYAPHAFEPAEETEVYWLHFDGPQARGYYEQAVGRSGNLLQVSESPSLERRFLSLYDLYSKNEPGKAPVLSLYLTEILTAFMTADSRNNREKKYEAIVEKAVSYIQEHFQENISTEALAALTHTSPSYLIRIFKRKTGSTPHDHLIARRMAAAEFLLRTTELPVKEVCFAVGFSDESVFCAAFRKWHGLPPGKYRTRHLRV